MAEWLHNAWSGWTGYTNNGKLPALLLAVLLYLWFGRKQKEQRTFLIYTTLGTIGCILPVTAAALMLYQTKFYDYQWIWSLVPLTAMVAYGGTSFWTEYRAENGGQWKKVLPVALILLTAVLFCGSLGKPVWNRREQKEERARAYGVIEQILDRYPEAEICLWAPREVMVYAREKNAAITLPYGRNLWDAALNAHSYDVYTDETILMGQWMESVSSTGEPDLEPEPQGEGVSEEANEGITLEKCVENALAQGVNCILIPAEAKPETVERLEAALGTGAEPLNEDYLLFIR